MYLTAAEQEDLVDYHEITSDYHDRGRWTDSVYTVVRKDGKFYGINWQSGLTEHQDNVFYDGEVEELFPVKRLNVTSTFDYMTAAGQLKSAPTVAQKLQADAESYEIATGASLAEHVSDEVAQAAKVMRELIDGLEPLDMAGNSEPFRLATAEYLDALIDLASGGKK